VTCTVSEDPYAIAEGMIAEEADLMRQMVELAEKRAKQQAMNNGYGPQRTDLHIKREMLNARNAAHDRALLRQIKEGLVDPAHAKSHNIDLAALEKMGKLGNG
jgi:hypothetical protein